MKNCLLLILILVLLAPVAFSQIEEPYYLGPAVVIPEPSPFEGAPAKAVSDGLAVDRKDRAAVVDFYQTFYLDSEGADAGWTGAIQNCIPGAVSQSYQDATLLRVNYFRAMVGLPAAITFNGTFDAKCQEAALMMIAEGALSHSPGTNWACYTADGAQAAGASNLALGSHGPTSIDRFMRDEGAGNTAVGHRRWILFPPQTLMGNGATTERNGFFNGSDSLWVIDQASWAPRPASPEWIAWPPDGYVPQQVVYPRWSFSYYRANFESASVSMTRNGQPISVDIEFQNSGNFLPDNSIVWAPSDLPASPPASDITYEVTINNVILDGVGARNFTYEVIVIDPDRVAQTATPTVTATFTPTATPVFTPTPPAFARRQEELFDLSVNWLSPDYTGPADVDGSGDVDHLDVIQGMHDWR